MQLKTTGNKLELLIIDQVVTNEYDKEEKDPNTFGLIGIQERSDQINARCEWLHNPDTGLRFTLSVDLS
jgi:signal transduction histidine kinase